MKIIVLSCSIYKDKSGIINAISEDEYITFSVPSLFSKTNKFAFLKEEFTVADVTLEKSKKTGHLVLKEAIPFFLPMSIANCLENLFLLKLSSEILNKCLDDEEKPSFYNMSLSLIESIKNKKNIFQNLLVYLANILRVGGYSFNTDSCVKCGNNNSIVGFSFIDGGFLCKNHYNKSIISDFGVEEILILHETFKQTSFLETYKHDISFEQFVLIIKNFDIFIKDNFGFNLLSFNLIK